MRKESMLQVQKEHYDFKKYVDLRRRDSYYHQIEQVCECDGNNILLIGVGDSIVVDVLKRLDKNVTTFDFDASLNPDIVGDVTKIDEIITKKYDVVVCCQVLEHIPFEMFDKTIEKISRITDNLVLSLPNKNIWIKNWFYMPVIRDTVWKFHFRIFWQNTWDIKREGFGEHYREIDAKPEWKESKIEYILKKYFKIEKHFVPFNMTYHMFWRLGTK